MFEYETKDLNRNVKNNINRFPEYYCFQLTEEEYLSLRCKNYIDDSILKMLTKKNKNVKVIILTSDKSNIFKLDIQKFNKEYPTLEVARINKFHDRFIIIDNKELYHIGASLKDLGKKCFAISKIDDSGYIKILNNKYITK